MLLKNYQILSEDARCNLHFLLQNVSGHDHVACRGYYMLLKKLGEQPKLHLKEPSTWDHLIGLSAAAKVFKIDLEVYIDQSQPRLTISQLYSLYMANIFNTKISLGAVPNAVQNITQDMIQSALVDCSQELLQQIVEVFKAKNLKPKYVIMPLETSIFSHSDLYDQLQSMPKEFKLKAAVETAKQDQYDYMSWIQTMNPEAHYACFYYALNTEKTGEINTDTIGKAMPYTPKILLGSVNIKNMDDLFTELLNSQMRRFEKVRVQPKDTLEVTHGEVLETFKVFLNSTHTLATDMFLTPLSAVLGYKFRFQATDDVVCFVTGAITTTKKNQDFVSYVDEYLFQSLHENCEIIKITIVYDTTQMSLTTEIMQIFKENNIVINHWKFNKGCVDVVCYSPGYASLVKVQVQIEKRIGLNAFSCPDMPRHPPNTQMPPYVDYSDCKKLETVMNYESTLKSFEQITPDSIQNSFNRLNGISAIDQTLIFQDDTYTDQIRSNVILVMENIQQTGSFKIRGGSNMLIKAFEQAKAEGKTIEGVVACSAGNHAQGVAKTSNLLGIKCTIVCPETAPETKLYNTMRYNAEVIKYGKVFDISNQFAINLAKERGWVFVPPYNHYDIIEGQGTIAHELLQKYQNVDTILVNVGGGGMISGIALYAKKMNPKIKIVGVQATRVFPLQDYNQTGTLKQVDKSAGTIADGCNVKSPGGIHNEILQKYVDEYISVDENEIAATIVNLLLTTKTLSEGAGCMGLSALLYDKYTPKQNENVAIIVCGGNIDIARLQQVFKLGTVSMGRRLKAKIQLPDVPGKLLDISKLIQKYGGIIDYVRHTRNVQTVDWDSTLVTLEIRMSCLKATNELKAEIKKLYPKAEFPAENLIPSE
ncbi:Threonine_dehydratase [Hexamita inflata]|uniref:Threonine dehydratase n=1 Tax=Hexamita inflata TaxID=28002 RepID=A0AA86V4M1_9EUKA|nr:Threonine dehydratase [Hexamita inflata]